MKEFRYVGHTPTDLDGGRPIEPGEFTGPIDEELPQNKRMIEEGLLIEAPHPDSEAGISAAERALAAEQAEATEHHSEAEQKDGEEE